MLQEGAIARTLCFRFANRIWALDDLLRDFVTASAAGSLDRILPEPPPIGGVWDLPPPEVLALVLARFDDDIKAAWTPKSSRAEHGERANQRLDKQKLYRILRLGYLAFPKFRYFAETDEIERFRTVIEAVIDTYADSKSEIAVACSEQSMTGVLARLEKMNVLDLGNEAVSKRNFEEWNLP